jgi:hypothetical protein
MIFSKSLLVPFSSGRSSAGARASSFWRIVRDSWVFSEIFDSHTGVLCADGILWTNGRPKGPELYRLLTHLGGLDCRTASVSDAIVPPSAVAAATQMRLPAHIVFVDNLLHNVESVRDVCGRLAPVHGYHYVPAATEPGSGGDDADDDETASPTTTTLEVGSDGALENATVSVSRQSQLVDAPVLAPFRAHAHRLAATGRGAAVQSARR